MKMVRKSGRICDCFLAALLLSFAWGGLGGCGRAINRTAERRIREALPDVLGTARQYRVHVEGAAERTMRGRLARVLIDGDDVELQNGLMLDQLHLDLQGVRYDAGQSRVGDIEAARFSVTVSENSLDEYLAGEAPTGERIRHTRVTFGANDQVTIAAERVLLGIGVPFSLTGPLRVTGRKVEIDPARLTVVGIPLSGTIARFLVKRFEGASDLSLLPFPVQLTEIHAARGALTLAGSADVTALLQHTQQTGK